MEIGVNTDEGVHEKRVQMITLRPGLSEEGDMEESRTWTPPWRSYLPP